MDILESLKEAAADLTCEPLEIVYKARGTASQASLYKYEESWRQLPVGTLVATWRTRDGGLQVKPAVWPEWIWVHPDERDPFDWEGILARRAWENLTSQRSDTRSATALEDLVAMFCRTGGDSWSIDISMHGVFAVRRGVREAELAVSSKGSLLWRHADQQADRRAWSRLRSWPRTVAEALRPHDRIWRKR